MYAEMENKMGISMNEQEREKALAILGKRFGFSKDLGGRTIEAEQADGRLLMVDADDKKIVIKAPSKAAFFRGISWAAMKEKNNIISFHKEEEIQFDFNGLMLDCSRNGVTSISYTKEMIERLAMMGHNVMMLYMEDVYEVDGEPYFGYLRGKYSKEELKELDSYANMFGIELIPCIQTLAHMDQFLKWDEPLEKYIDIDNILLVGDEKVSDLLERMLKSLSECFTSKRIHLGMDEAYQLGRGRYADKNGLEEKTDIMHKHLSHLLKLCQKYGLRPMMWDDMFFRDYSNLKGREYEIPKGMDLMYWDYYNNKKDHYIENIELRRKLTPDTMFAGGAWSWVGYTPHHTKTITSVNASLSACKELGVNEVIVTAWSDDGCECPVSACLLGTVLFAEHGYARELDFEQFKERLKFCTGLSYEDFMLQEAFDILPEMSEKANMVTPSKYMLYEDLLCSMFVCHTKEIKEDLTPYYAELETKFREAAANEKDSYLKLVKEFYASYARVLKLKWNMGLRIYESYNEENTAELKKIAEGEIPDLIEALEEFRMLRMLEWNKTNKTNGFEALDIRIGGLIQRAKTTKYRLSAYVNKETDKIEELEEERLYATHYREEGMGDIIHFNRSLKSMTPARMIW